MVAEEVCELLEVARIPAQGGLRGPPRLAQLGKELVNDLVHSRPRCYHMGREGTNGRRRGAASAEVLLGKG